MDNKIGIAFSSNYLKQGSNIEKCKISNKNKIPNIVLSIREDKKEFDISEDKKNYSGNIIYNVPSVSYNLNNIKTVEDIINSLIINKIKTITINPTNMILSDYEWSTKQEQNKVFKNIVETLASIASNKLEVLIENPKDTKSKVYFGHDVETMQSILLNSRKTLIKKYNFTENEANKYLKISLNTSGMNQSDVVVWLNSFKESLSMIKVTNTNYTFIYNYLKTNNFKRMMLIYTTSTELESVINEYKGFSKMCGVEIKEKTKKKKEKKSKTKKMDYPTMIQIGIILLTVFIAFLMIYVKFQS